ncbi:hypothetical protein [Alkaliflexus imshenetskii]|uniref:hypothetical protein n=1 Tax=Alkaliflexus imshenetskii TaxID=286730 RepID=UPI0004BA8903|nr:hypothetical protein [Alkaliflexus imshenetskii]
MRIRSLFNVRLVAFWLFFFSAMIHSISQNSSDTRVLFPRGIGVNVGQVGWMSGSSEDPSGGPWRAGIRRDFDVRDYKPMVEVGQELGIRFMSLFILGEFDRLNILGEYPTSNPDGENWDNTRYIGPRQIEIMDYVKRNAANIEFGITGVLHEYWEDGFKTRAEWFDVANQKPRNETIIRRNVELLKRLMAQYGITPENGHSFPESFIAYGFYFNPEAEYSLGKVLSENGIKYANTPFATIHGLNRPPLLSGGFDHGVLLLDRFNHGNLWYDYGAVPSVKPDDIQSVVVESHWANWLGFDDFLQPAVNQEWIDFLLTIQRDPNHYLAKNTEQLYSQWLYKKNTIVEEKVSGIVLIDNRNMPNEGLLYNLLGNMVLAVALKDGEHISEAVLNGDRVASVYETEGYAYLYLPPLEKKIYELQYSVGRKRMNRIVQNDGTYNIYRVAHLNNQMEIELKMYGEQIVKIYTDKPKNVRSLSSGLELLSFDYDKRTSILSVKLRGKDMQGEIGRLQVDY